jgi:hypothetical protein
VYVNPATGTVIVRLGWSLGALGGGQWVSLFQGIAGEAARYQEGG